MRSLINYKYRKNYNSSRNIRNNYNSDILKDLKEENWWEQNKFYFLGF